MQKKYKLQLLGWFKMMLLKQIFKKKPKIDLLREKIKLKD